MRRPAFRFAAILMFAAVALLLCGSPAHAKSYSMPSVRIDAEVRPNGDLLVTEQRTFDFSGSFSFVYWELDTVPSDPAYPFGPIEVLSVAGPGGEFVRQESTDRIPGRYAVIDQGTSLRIEAYHDTTDAQATFTLRYVVHDAAKRWDDTGELYWKFIGDRWDAGVGSVVIEVRFPPGVTEDTLRVWAHGPLTGVVSKAGNLMRLSVDDLPPATFVEARALFPRDALAEARDTPGMREQTVLAEEGRWAEEANAARRRARLMVGVAALFGAFIPLLSLLTAFALWRRHGKEFRPSFDGPYFRELPAELPPAVVGALMRWGSVGENELTATLMDLSNRGIVTVEPVHTASQGLLGPKTETEWRLSIPPTASLDSLSNAERQLLEAVFGAAEPDRSVTIEELKREAKKHPERYAESIEAWKKAVAAEAERHGFFEKRGTRLLVSFIAWGIVLFFITIASAAAAGSGWTLLVGIPCAVGVGVIGLFMPRRTPKANELHAKYRALKRYLEDFSRLDEAPPTHVVLWEHFLVLAVVFGIAEKVIETLRVKAPQVLEDPALAHAAWWATPQPGFGSPASVVTSGFASASQIASSQMSSASGGGGGFSGGGGGGGGGGAG